MNRASARRVGERWETDDGDQMLFDGHDEVTVWSAEGRAFLAAVKGAFRVYSASTLAQQPPPRREWLVPGLIPAGNVTLLSGDGGIGKSRLSLQLAFATASGLPWLGFQPARGPALYLSAEDDCDELHRRLCDIAGFYGAPVAAAELQLLDATEAGDTALGVSDNNGGVRATSAFAALEAKVAEMKPKLLVLDSLADVYGGNENIRSETRGFISMLRRLARPHQTAILMLAHPSLRGIETGSGMSGSTAWNNSVRSRLYMQRPKDADADVRVLVHHKSNYGPLQPDLRMRSAAGGFDLEDRQEVSRAQAESDAKVDALFLHLLSEYNASGLKVRPNPGRGYAPDVFSEDHRAKGVKNDGFRAAMRRLLAEHRIKVVESGPPSRRALHLEVC